MADLLIQRGEIDVGIAGAASAIGTAVSDISSAFVINTNNRNVHAGSISSNGNMEADDMSGGMYLSGANLIQFDRQVSSLSQSMRHNWEVWEYTGLPSDPDEFIVRGRTQHVMLAETDQITISGITNIDKCIPHITGIFSSETVDGADTLTAVAWMSGTDQLNIKRGSGTNNTVTVYVTVVEYTGSAWDIKHGRITSAADTGTITLVDAADGLTSGGGDVLDWTKAAIYGSFVSNSLDGTDDAIADTSATYFPNASTTQVDFAFHTDHADGGTGAGHMVHVLKHSTDLVVTRYSDIQGAEGAMPLDISSAGLNDLTKSSAIVSRSSSGTGGAYGRGFANIKLVTTTSAEMWCHRSGNTVASRIEILNFADPPVIGINDQGDEQLNVGAVGELADGFGFEAVQGSGKLELVDNIIYASGTKVAQTINSWSDTQIDFDTQFGAFADGTLYLFVTNNSGDISVGYAINFGIITYEQSVINLNPDHFIPFDGSYDEIIKGFHAVQTPSGTPSFAANPLTRGRAQSFLMDDLNDHTEMPDSAYTNITNLHTIRYINLWFTVDSIQLTPSALWEEGGGVNNFYFVLGFGNVLLANVADSSLNFKIQAWSDFKLAINRTYMATIKWEDLSGDNEFRLFVDGVLMGSHDGNPVNSNGMSLHSGDMSFGRPDGALDTGGTDIQYEAATVAHEQDWCTFSAFGGGAPLTPTQIRFDLFEMGVLADITIASDTEANMQLVIDAVNNTSHGNAACIMKIEGASDTLSPSFSFTNQLFDPLASIHVQWLGGGTVTLVNSGTSDIDDSKISTLAGGTAVVENPATLTVTGIINGAEVRIYDDNLGANDLGTELAGTEANSGTTFPYSHNGVVNDVLIQMMANGYEEELVPVSLSSLDQTLTLLPTLDANA